MKIRQALLSAAGRNQRTLPLQTLVDRDGVPKAALQILLDEITAAGVESVAVVISPGDENAYIQASGPHRDHVVFLPQEDPLGFGHAVACATPFLREEPFLLVVGDHLYLSRLAQSCARQLLDVAEAENCAVSAVQPTFETKLPYYGTVGGRRVAGRPGVYLAEVILEKPTPTEAEQRLIVPGLRAGHYLCFFGMHVLPPAVLGLLRDEAAARPPSREQPLQLTPALAALAARERYLAAELQGVRHDIGARYGIFGAQLALALAGRDRDEVLAQLVELLARDAGKPASTSP